MNIALLGFGTVGMGVEKLIDERRADIEREIEAPIKITKALVQNKNKDRNAVSDIYFTDDYREILEDNEIDTIVEVTSSIDEAYEYMKEGLKAGKNIVTANKAAISKHFEELSFLADEMEVGFLYEASVAGAIPIIRPLIEEIPMNDIEYLRGILNGSSNYVLSKMEEEGAEYGKVIEVAKDKGYAEANPYSDMSGLDSKRKLRILSTIFMGGKIKEEDIATFGILTIKKIDIEKFKEKNLKVRLIAEGGFREGKPYAMVIPSLVGEESPFYSVKEANNKVEFKGTNVGVLRFYGAGAGGKETADSVVRDLINLANDRHIKTIPLSKNEISLTNEDFVSKFYLRVPKAYEEDVANHIEEDLSTKEDTIFITKNMSYRELKGLLKETEEEKYFYARIMEG